MRWVLTPVRRQPSAATQAFVRVTIVVGVGTYLHAEKLLRLRGCVLNISEVVEEHSASGNTVLPPMSGVVSSSDVSLEPRIEMSPYHTLRVRLTRLELLHDTYLSSSSLVHRTRCALNRVEPNTTEGLS